MSKPTIGLAIITRNGEEKIDRCLKSCYDLFDEIVIVDTGSTDKTKEIALKYTDKVYDFIWIDDFAAARNFSFDKINTDFILWLDDDDVILPKDKEKIKNLDLTNKEVVLLRYQYSHDEFGVSECTLERERIIKKSLGLRWQKAIHEYIPLTNQKISREDIEIHHWKKQGTSERNIRILEKIVQTDPDCRNIFYLGKELLDFGRTQDSIKYLEQFISMKVRFWEDVFSAHDIIAKAYLLLNNQEKFFYHLFESIKIEPRRAEPYYAIADYYHSIKDYQKAIHYYEICLNLKRNPELLSTYYPQFYTWKPAINLCQCYNYIGDVQKSYEANEIVLKFRSKDNAALNNKSILQSSQLRFIKKDGQGKKLNLGCGDKSMLGFVNVDIVKTNVSDENFNLYEIPYKDNTISTISSEHSLEHVSKEKTKLAIKEWFRVLQPGGVLRLYIPDLELCAAGYVNGDNNKTINGYQEKDWYKMTIYGAQVAENGSDAEHQFHLTGFSKLEIQELLEESGFIIDYIFNY